MPVLHDSSIALLTRGIPVSACFNRKKFKIDYLKLFGDADVNRVYSRTWWLSDIKNEAESGSFSPEFIPKGITTVSAGIDLLKLAVDAPRYHNLSIRYAPHFLGVLPV